MTTVAYSFNPARDVGLLLDEINEWLGCSLVAPGAGSDDTETSDRFLGMRLSFGEGSYSVDDSDLTHHLACHSDGTAGADDSLPMSTMAMIAHALHRRLGIAGALSGSEGRLIARYQERIIGGHGKCLYDTVSGTPFTDFAVHLAVLLRATTDAPPPRDRMDDTGDRYSYRFAG